MTQQLDPKQVRGLKEELDTLDSMVKIKSIGANLSLDEEGELSATGGGGGGSGVNLYSTLGNNIDGALTQKASTDLLVHAKPDGTNDLISNNKITLGYLPDSVLGQVVYGGGFDPTTAEATLTTNAQEKLGTSDATITLTNDTTAITGYEANEGIYYIATASGTFASISFQTGDWLISTGTAWSKVDNTDAVTGVKGNEEVNYRLGNVNITAQNVGAVTSDNAISTQDITPFVTTSMIADSNVTTAKIQDEAVTTAKIDDGAVTTDKLDNRAVTANKIANSAAIGRPIEIFQGNNVDLNTMTNSGIHKFYTPYSNGPGSYTYCSMLVMAYDDDYRCSQYFTGINDSGIGIIAVRFSHNNSGTRAWSSWKILDQWS